MTEDRKAYLARLRGQLADLETEPDTRLRRMRANSLRVLIRVQEREIAMWGDKP